MPGSVQRGLEGVEAVDAQQNKISIFMLQAPSKSVTVFTGLYVELLDLRTGNPKPNNLIDRANSRVLNDAFIGPFEYVRRVVYSPEKIPQKGQRGASQSAMRMAGAIPVIQSGKCGRERLPDAAVGPLRNSGC